MKTSYKYLAIAFAALLCSCNEGITPDMIDSQVQISANITPRVLTRVTEDGKSFTDGDMIKVQNINRENKNLATYTYSESTGKWSTSDELYWDGESANTFNAWYPATAAYGSFTIPADQTTGTDAADWMTATASAKKVDGTVNLSFNHNLAKVTVTIDSWSNEYSANEKVANSLELNSLSSEMSYDGTLSGDNTAKWVKSHVAQANTSFVAIIAPATYASDEDIIQVYVNGSSTPLAVKTSSVLTIEPGKAYSFKLAVGKDLAAISSSVTIGGWDDETLEDQEAISTVTKTTEYIDEYGINHGAGVETNGIIWAPVNCGYHATDYPYGKLYQWGRKYGQGYKGRTYVNNSLDEVADATYATVSNARVSLEQGQNVLNKDFYYMSSNYQDWTFESNDQLWNSGTESSPVKTQYDPCPLGWRVPTYLETQSLCGGIMSVNEYGQTGFIFKPQTNPDSDQSVFLTIGGRWTPFGYADDREFVGYYWTSKSASNGQAYYHLLHESSIILDDNIRMYGCSVRCVQDNADIEPITSLTINEISVDMLIGQHTYITASISPLSVYDILWQSSDTSIATIDNQSGKIIGVSEGTVTISASAGGLTATCMVNVIKPTDYIDEYGVNHGTGVIIDNVYWAPVNCGYRISMFEYGKLYQWGRKYGQGYTGRMADDYGSISKTYSDWTLPTYASGGVSATKGNLESNSNVFFNSNSNKDWVNPQNDKLWNAGTESEPVKTSYDPCPEGWRVPTESEMEMLSENFSDIINYNGKRGRWFSGSNPYGTDVSRIFLPAAGAMSGNGSYAKARGAIGSYWTSGVYGKDMYYDYDKSLAMTFDQSSYNTVIYTSERGLGLSVRCVHE